MYLKRQAGTANETHIASLLERRGGANEGLSEASDPPALSLDERGMIQNCNKTFEMLSGFRRSELVWRHISSLFPQFTDIELVQSGEINPLLNYLCRCGHLYRMRNPQGDGILSYLNIFRISNDGTNFIRLIVRRSDMDTVSFRH